jgi:hypothetical protein
VPTSSGSPERHRPGDEHGGGHGTRRARRIGIAVRAALVGLFVIPLLRLRRRFATFQWDELLLEVDSWPSFYRRPRIVVWLYRWLLFRYLFMAGAAVGFGRRHVAQPHRARISLRDPCRRLPGTPRTRRSGPSSVAPRHARYRGGVAFLIFGRVARGGPGVLGFRADALTGKPLPFNLPTMPRRFPVRRRGTAKCDSNAAGARVGEQATRVSRTATSIAVLVALRARWSRSNVATIYRYTLPVASTPTDAIAPLFIVNSKRYLPS